MENLNFNNILKEAKDLIIQWLKYDKKEEFQQKMH